MKVVYHPRFTEVYSYDPAASLGRIEAILEELGRVYDYVEPRAASEDDLRRVHTQYHIESIKRDRHLYDVACLAAGGAVEAARIAMAGEASFGLIRPPGHHASPDHCWGFCYFNNIAVALARLQSENLIENALILDFDLHFGDGTNNVFAGGEVEYLQPDGRDGQSFIEGIINKFRQGKSYSILAVSAGFDRHVEDWGGQLTTDDYRTIGALVKEAAEKHCEGRRFAVLEGGYNYHVLGKNVKAFLEGLA